jgi:hypothetical protein
VLVPPAVFLQIFNGRDFNYCFCWMMPTRNSDNKQCSQSTEMSLDRYCNSKLLSRNYDKIRREHCFIVFFCIYCMNNVELSFVQNLKRRRQVIETSFLSDVCFLCIYY